MRALFGIAVACAFQASSVAANPVPANSDDAAPLRIEASQDRWQGRHHYLYDDENQPGAETVGTAPSDARGCAQQPVRLKRSDGTTVVRRLKRCD